MKLKKEWIGILSLLMILLVLFFIKSKQPIIIEEANDMGSFQRMIKVYITGAVKTPGVYEVNESDRLDVLIAQAGGVTTKGDMTGINLAKVLKDGEMIVIPEIGETRIYQGIDILNYGDLDEILSVNGIGEVLGKRIIAYREEHGLFSDFQDLLQVDGIGESKLKSIENSLMN